MSANSALMLINLGSPRSYAEKDVQTYLQQFLMDPLVIDVPYLLRLFIVKMILFKRLKITSQNYAKIWTKQGSPLLVNSCQLLNALKKQYSGKTVLAMRYGNPSITNALAKLADYGIYNVKLLPLYPHYTQSTVESTIHKVMQINKQTYAKKFNFKVIPPFFAHPSYINSLCELIRPYLNTNFEHLVFSFHGVPERHIRKLTNILDKQHDLTRTFDLNIAENILAKCYRSQCIRSANLVALQLNLPADKWSIAFQSRVGGGKWITPYLSQHLQGLAEQGKRNILITAPSFVADCIETLEELAIRYADNFANNCQGKLKVIPCLNSQPSWIKALIEIANH